MSDKHESSGRVRDAVRTRAALLDAAQEIFLRDGYAAAATEEIVVQAGVTRGALYHHFANKRVAGLSITSSFALMRRRFCIRFESAG